MNTKFDELAKDLRILQRLLSARAHKRWDDLANTAVRGVRTGNAVAYGLLLWILAWTTTPALQMDLLQSFGASSLTLGPDGNVYGVTGGTAFRITPTGAFTTVCVFDTNTGSGPMGLTLGSDGSFYGGMSSPPYIAGTVGSIFKLTTTGGLTTLALLTNAPPASALTFGADGSLYGAADDGLYNGVDDYGSVFRVTTNGVFRVLAQFGRFNGLFRPHAVIFGPDGNLYGTTYEGGPWTFGTIFKLTTNGTLTVLTAFNGTNGAYPTAPLTLGPDGNFYGTTREGGSAPPPGAPGSPGGNGTIFRVTPSGQLTTLFRFDPPFSVGNGFWTNATGYYPGTLVLGPDGNFYGTCRLGGGGPDAWGGLGTVFRVTTNGILTTLIAFNWPWYNGSEPNSIVFGRDGNIYGTTFGGGPQSQGVIFRLLTAPVFTGVAKQSDGTVLLAGTGLGQSYRLWRSPSMSLPFGAWDLLTSGLFDGNSDFSFIDTGARTNPASFYRISVP